MDRGIWQTRVHGVAKVRQDIGTKPPPPTILLILIYIANWLLYICMWMFITNKPNTVFQNINLASIFAIKYSSVQLLSRVRLFATPWTAACQAFLSITNSQCLLKLMPIGSVMPSNHLILCHHLLLLPLIFLGIRVFSRSQFFTSGGQSVGVSTSASVLPMNIQDFFPLDGLVGLLCSPRDSQESSPTTQFKSINTSALSFLYSPTLTFIHDYWKNHNFDWMELWQQSDVYAF